MIIRVEPKEFFMSTVYLIFNREQGEPEDEEVKRYLAERQLAPKREWQTTYEERDCQIWQFGGCYLGKHLDMIAEIQRKYIETEMLAAEIPHLLKEGGDVEIQQATQGLPEAQLQELVGILVKEFHQESAFGVDEAGHVQVTLASAAVQQRFKELVAASSQGQPGELSP
jgi:hypothetical protein